MIFATDKKFLAIAINEGAIKIAQASTSGVVERVARGLFTGNPGGEQALETLKGMLVPFNRNLPVIGVIPASAATAKTIEVPSSDPEEIKSIINLQASRHTPYSREEVLIGYINLEMNANQNTRILLVIVHRNMVKERLLVLEKLGLQIDKIIFVPEAQARFYIKAMNLKKDAAAFGLIDVSSVAANYIIMAKGSLLFERHIPVGIKTLMEGGEAPAKLQDELKRSMDAFMQEDGIEAPRSYLLSSPHPALDAVLPALKQALGIEVTAQAFPHFIKASADLRKKLQSDFAEDSFLDVISSASCATKCEINLMPEEMILKKLVHHQSQEISKAGVAAVIIMVLVGAMILSNIYFKDVFLNKNLREHYAPQKAQVAELQEKMHKVRLVREYMAKRMVSLDIIHELYDITPHTIYLNNIAVDEDGTVSIDGIADSMSLVYSYVKSLADSASFKDAKLKDTSTKKENNKDVAAFDIEFKYGSKETEAPPASKPGGTV